jgi:hypothetical protein
LSQKNSLRGFIAFDRLKRSMPGHLMKFTVLMTAAEIINHGLEDIAARNELRVALKLINNISEGLMVIDQDIITWVNQASRI